MGFARKLEGVLHELKPLVDQGKVAGFFLNVENSGKLAGLAEDVHTAMMEYQTSLQQDIYEKGCLLIVSLTPASHFHVLTYR